MSQSRPGTGGGRGAASPAPAVGETPACRRSPLCGSRFGRTRQSLQRVEWKQTLGYTFTYPYVLPPGFGGVPAVALDSKGNLWAFQRADPGKPQLFKFDPNDRLILQVGQDVIGYQDKAHGMAVDAERQCLDYRRERRHRDEDQSGRQASPDDRRTWTPGGLE